MIMKLNELIHEVFADGRYDPNIFKAIFILGSAASGKSTITKKLIGRQQLSNIGKYTSYTSFSPYGLKYLNIDDVLYCLILDAQSGTESFEDFCDNFGYNEDSVKHNEIYKLCQKNGKKVKTFITNLEKASELFQNY